MSNKRFEIEVEQTNGVKVLNIVTDKETGVQYLLVAYGGIGVGITPLLKNDGLPLTLNN